MIISDSHGIMVSVCDSDGAMENVADDPTVSCCGR
jgi:hypothetical protein